MQQQLRADPFLTNILGANFHWAVTSSSTPPAPGFYLVDARFTMERPIHGLSAVPVPAGYAIRQAQPADEDDVAAIAAVAFTCSRFHNDPAIPKALANKIKEKWARNFFRGLRGDAMIIAAHGKTVVGFNLLIKKDNVLIIDLIAVNEAHRQRGLATAMISEAATTPSVNLIRVGTQLSNIPSLRAYEKAGFIITNTEHVWHCHTAPT